MAAKSMFSSFSVAWVLLVNPVADWSAVASSPESLTRQAAQQDVAKATSVAELAAVQARAAAVTAAAAANAVTEAALTASAVQQQPDAVAGGVANHEPALVHKVDDKVTSAAAAASAVFAAPAASAAAAASAAVAAAASAQTVSNEKLAAPSVGATASGDAGKPTDMKGLPYQGMTDGEKSSEAEKPSEAAAAGLSSASQVSPSDTGAVAAGGAAATPSSTADTTKAVAAANIVAAKATEAASAATQALTASRTAANTQAEQASKGGAATDAVDGKAPSSMVPASAPAHVKAAVANAESASRDAATAQVAVDNAVKHAATATAQAAASTAAASAVVAAEAASKAARDADDASSMPLVQPSRAVDIDMAAAAAAKASGAATNAAAAAAKHAEEATQTSAHPDNELVHAAAASVAAETAAKAAVHAATEAEAAAVGRASKEEVSNQASSDTVGALRGGNSPSGVASQDGTSVDSWWFRHAPQVYAYVVGISFASFIKMVCMVGNILVQVSPLPTTQIWEKRGCTGEADAAPYVSIAFGGFQWCFYGMFAWALTQRSGFLILVQSNCLGAILGAYYAVCFSRNCRRGETLVNFHRYLVAVSGLACFQMVITIVLPLEKALFLVGLVASFCSFMGAFSMLVTVPQVIRTECSRSIPGAFAVANLFCSVAWTICGVILVDPLVTGPNIAGATCSGICIYLKLRYPSQVGETDAILKNKTAGSKHTPTEFTPLARAARECAERTAAMQGDTSTKPPLPPTVEVEGSVADVEVVLFDAADRNMAATSSTGGGSGETGSTF